MVLHKFAFRVLAALVLGALMGAERQLRQRMAGLRTNALVAAGAAWFVAVSLFTSDPKGSARVAGQVVSDISFLGAGVIMREGLNVRGLNTAATLCCSAAIGVLAGMGHAPEAAVGPCFVLGANFALRGMAQRLNRRVAAAALQVEQPYGISALRPQLFRLSRVCLEQELARITGSVKRELASARIECVHLRSSHSQGTQAHLEATVRCTLVQRGAWVRLVQGLGLDRTVRAVRWQTVIDDAPPAGASGLLGITEAAHAGVF